MKSITDLSGLLTDNLKRLYSSEQHLLTALPKLASKADSSALSAQISAYVSDKKANIERLKSVFELLGTTAGRHKCELTEALIEDCQASISNTAKKHVTDAALISTLQQINHFNIANYGTVASYAGTLKKTDIARLLHDALTDEKNVDEELSIIAEETVNPSAVMA